MTFEEFVRYVLWTYEHNHQVDAHFNSQYENCRPCHINYDYIGHYETIHDDGRQLIRKFSTGSNVHFPAFDSRVRGSSKYLNLYDTIPVTDIRRLLDFYKNDYILFGYNVPDFIRRRLDKANTQNSSLNAY